MRPNRPTELRDDRIFPNFEMRAAVARMKSDALAPVVAPVTPAVTGKGERAFKFAPRAVAYGPPTFAEFVAAGAPVRIVALDVNLVARAERHKAPTHRSVYHPMREAVTTDQVLAPYVAPVAPVASSSLAPVVRRLAPGSAVNVVRAERAAKSNRVSRIHARMVSASLARRRAAVAPVVAAPRLVKASRPFGGFWEPPTKR